MPESLSALNQVLVVPSYLHGQRVDQAIAQLMPDYSRSQLTTWLKEGLITVNQQNKKPKEKIKAGDEIHLQVTLESETDYQAENIPLSLIFEDEHLLVLNKPAGLVVHPGAGNQEHTLANALLYHLPSLLQLPRAGIVHRLDKDTTGLLVVAKTMPAHTNLVRQMQAREIHRHYVALVQGHVISGGSIETYYGRHPRHRLKMAVLENASKEAITHYRIRQHFEDFTLLDVELETGRTHQIRVHMAHIKHPVIGDPLYGRLKLPLNASPELIDELKGFKRQALHAERLVFNHPITGETLSFEAPLPEDFQALLTYLDEDFEDDYC